MPSFEIHTLDLRFQNCAQAIAAYLITGSGGSALVETGAGSTLPALCMELARFGLEPADIHDVLLTHIHLDHAGAAGWWAQHGARIHVHHAGASHLVDPSRLLNSAQRVYGDEMQKLWGDFLPSPAESVHALNDGDVIEIAGLKITALGTPGHARHHMVYRLEDVAFTGDQAGICLEGYSHIHMPTPPPEFDLEAWVASVDRLRQQNYKRLYLTHFGRIDQVEEHWSGVETLLREATAFVGRRLAENASRETIIREYAEMEEKRMQDSALDLRGRSLYADLGPAEMSVDGLIRYWKKRELQPASYFSGRGVLI